MFNFFRTSEGETKNFVRGMLAGLAGALILLVIILAIIFGDKIKVRFFSKNEETNPSAAKVRITIITSRTCQECWDVNLFLSALKQNNIKEIGQETLYFEDKLAKDLVAKYNITRIPTVLIAGELNKDQNLQQIWANLGEIIDNVFVFRQVIPPYIEVASGELKGKFFVTFLTVQSCAECYDVNLHQNALLNLGLDAKDAKTVDVASDEGQELVKKYNIKAAPTILLSGDLGEYRGLSQVWPTVGEITQDGTYIFTEVKQMGTYKDLGKNKVVKVATPASPETSSP